MKIILADDSEDIRDLFSMNIRAFLEAQIFECSSSKEAIKLLEENPDVDIIVSDLHMPEGNGDEIYQYLREEKLRIPFILVTGIEKLNDYPALHTFLEDFGANAKVDKPPVDNALKKAIDKALTFIEPARQRPSPRARDEVEMELDNYMPITIRNFKRTNSSPVDIYLKLSSQKFLKIFHQNEMFSTQEIEKYERKRIKNLYVQRSDFLTFTNYLSAIMAKALELSEKTTLEEMSALHRDSFDFIQKNLRHIGISSELIEIAKGAVATSIKMMENDSNLSKLLKLSQNASGYGYRHSLMTSFVASALAEKLEWQSKEIKIKLSLAALMHDLTIEDQDTIKLYDQRPDLMARAPHKVRKNYLEHPQEIASMVEKIKDFPHNLATILIQHHELPNGKGFPRGLNSTQVSHLSCLFIIAHEFVNLMIDTDFSVSRRDNALISLCNTYSTGNYKDVLKGLTHIFEGD